MLFVLPVFSLTLGLAPSGAAAPQEIKIGVILPLTGALAPTGNDLKHGVELAAELINGGAQYQLPLVGHNGLPNFGGAKIKIVFADSQGKPDQGKTVAEELITQEHVVALMGAYQSAVTATASQVAERYGVPYLNPDSSSPTLVKRDFKYFFRTTPDDSTFSKNFFDFLGDLKKSSRLNVKSIAIVSEDTLFGKGATDTETANANQGGYAIGASVFYPNGTAEVNSEVQRVKASGADVIIMASYVADATLFMRTFKEQGVAPQAILAQDAGFVDQAYLRTLGKDGWYVFSREVWSLNMRQGNPATASVDAIFRGRYGTHMDGNIARDFTGLIVLADAINRAKSTDAAKIVDALKATNISGKDLIMPWRGIKFGDNGQNMLGSGIIVQIQGGNYVTVWPQQFAVAKPVWPFPAWDKR